MAHNVRRSWPSEGTSWDGRTSGGISQKLLLLIVSVVVASVVGVVAAPPAAAEIHRLEERHERPTSPGAKQIPIVANTGSTRGGNPQIKRRKLHGRFLHISDIHPDPHYVPHASPSNACHVPLKNTDPELDPSKRKKGDNASRVVGKYGAPTTSCDSPQSLVNATFDWIKREFMRDDLKAGEGIDFVIWTGDSARHDNDIQRPRTWKEILELNTMIVEKMKEVFGDEEGLKDPNPNNDFKLPIVPTLGNNDIMPHNIFLPGPSVITREYLHLWRSFIPEDQYHIFDRGAYFWKEVIPGNYPKSNSDPSKTTQRPPGTPDKLHHGGLAVISLNSMYFFSSNTAVDGCDLHTEPGYEQFEWLRHQLQLMRDTGMKAILIGHVPPARVREVGWREGGKGDWEVGWGKRSWDETCWRKWVAWNQQYRDVIAGSIFGHMNLDHFMILDTEELKREHKPRKGKGGRGQKGKKGKKGKGSGKAGEGFAGNRGKNGQTKSHPNSASSYSSIDDFGTAGKSIYKPGFSHFRTHPTILMTEDSPICPPNEEPGQIVTITSAEDYLQSLRETFKRLPLEDFAEDDETTPNKDKFGGKYAERYVLNIVGPSVVPNYFPTLRIVEYNISRLVDDEGFLLTPEYEGAQLADKQKYVPTHDSSSDSTAQELFVQRRPSPEEVDAEISKIPQEIEEMKKNKGKKPSKKPRKPADPLPNPPPKGSLPGPGYLNQPFSLLGYLQYYANLTRINAAAGKKGLVAEGVGKLSTSGASKGDDAFYYEIEYDTKTDKVYKLEDMTVRSYIKLAKRLVDASGFKFPKKGNGKGRAEGDGICGLTKVEAKTDGEPCLDSSIEPDKEVRGKRKRDWIWREFLNRAFVRTATKEELDALVGYKG